MLAKKHKTLEERTYQRIAEWKEYTDSEDCKEEVLNLVREWLEQPYFEEEEQDCGYDCSYYPKKTDKKLKDLNFETVGDVLEQRNGQTEATFVSGSGIGCETWRTSLEEILGDEIYEFIKEGFSKEEFEKINCELDIITDMLSDQECDEYSLAEKFSELKL